MAYHNLLNSNVWAFLPCGFSARICKAFFSEPNFYVINGEKTVRSLCSISGKAGGWLDGKFSWKNLTNWPVASRNC